MAVILVTGAATQIGQNVARQLIKDGHDVALTDPDRHSVQQIVWESKDLIGTALRVDSDLGFVEEARSLVETTVQHYGHIDAVVNAIWSVPAPGRLHELESDYFEATLGIFMRELHLTMRALLLHFLQEGGGVILNITSAEAIAAEDLDGTTQMASYLTESFSNRAALEYAHENIRIRFINGMAMPTADVCRMILSEIDFVAARNPQALAGATRGHAAS